MTETIKNNLEKLQTLFTGVDQVLEEYFKDKAENETLKMSVFLGMLSVKFNWNEKETQHNDPLIRFHIRNHSDWVASRGIKGGIGRRSEKDKKNAIKSAKEAAKQQISAALDEKLKQNP
jgi:hypothetical protein